MTTKEEQNNSDELNNSSSKQEQKSNIFNVQHKYKNYLNNNINNSATSNVELVRYTPESGININTNGYVNQNFQMT